MRAVSSQRISASLGTPKALTQSHIGSLIARRFDGLLFAGYVTLHYPIDGEEIAYLWRVEYEDGDEEDWNYEDILRGIQLDIKCRMSLIVTNFLVRIFVFLFLVCSANAEINSVSVFRIAQ